MSTLGLKKEFINGNFPNGLEEEAHLIFSAVLCSLVRKGFCPGHRECIDNHFSIDENALFPSLPKLPLIKLNSESYLQIFLKKNALSESELATWFDSHFKYEVISDNSLKIVSSFTTGTHTFFSKNKVLHRSNGPAYLRFSKNEAIQREFYYINGKNHREAGPASIFYYENGKICNEAYYINGKCHRLDGPAWINYHENGKIYNEAYYIDGKCHRLDGPAWIHYHENGKIDNEAYFINGKFHRLDGPASINYHKNGEKKCEYYYMNNKYHRVDGPAIIHFRDTGCVKQYFYKGKEYNVSSFEEFLEYVESQKLLEYFE